MNEKRQRVVLYGDSLVLAGMRASLGLFPDFEIIALAAPSSGPVQVLRTLHPAAVIFDLRVVQADFPFTLLQDQPGVLLVGIDPGRNQVVLWSGQRLHELSTRDLVQVIQDHLPEGDVDGHEKRNVDRRIKIVETSS
jgi:hypothetical protein